MSATLLPQSTAHAYSPTASLPYDPAKWQTKVDAAFPSGSNFSDWRNMNYIVFDYDGNSSITMVGSDTGFALSDGSATTSITAQVVCRWDNSTLSYPGCDPPASSSFSTSTVYALHLTAAWQTAHQSQYDALPQAYKDLTTTPPSGGTVDPRYNTCGLLDFVCYYGNVMTFFGIVGSFIGDFFTNIGTTFSNIATNIGETVLNVFIPAQNHLSDTFNALGSFFQSKFGFVAWIITFLKDLFTSLTIENNGDACQSFYSYGYCVKTFSAPSGIIPVFGIDFGVIEKYWPSLWQLLQTALIGTTAYFFIVAIYHKYMRILRG
ncbi:MAG TPA: hypothetical protein VLG36_03920 [Candidatus Chromulinivoraceae bacterium]|nr:hypothetical protein [Candidatus Chromulinivoraceae bacterium]